MEDVQLVTEYFTADATGLFTCLVSDEYEIKIKLSIGREGAGGESQIYTRAVVNGVPVGDTTHTIVATSRIEIPQFINLYYNFSAGDTFYLEFIRDIDGSDSGGLRAGIPDVAGWASSPSAKIQFVRTYTV